MPNSLREFYEDFSDAGVTGAPNSLFFSVVPSTNTTARRIASGWSSGLTTGVELAVLALEQIAGRGRRGNIWDSPPGGIYATLVVRSQARWTLDSLPIRTTTGLCQSLQEAASLDVRVKWPNDLMVAGKKIGGVLIETVSAPGSPTRALVGFGINYSEIPASVQSTATSVHRESATVPAPGCLAAQLVGGIVEHLKIRKIEVLTLYRSLTLHSRGDELLCRTGVREVSGRFRGFSETGHLCLETDTGLREISSGEIIEPACSGEA